MRDQSSGEDIACIDVRLKTKNRKNKCLTWFLQINANKNSDFIMSIDLMLYKFRPYYFNASLITSLFALVSKWRK
jgi:hypothetical protein